MGKIKGFLFAVRHREILMTDLGLKGENRHPFLDKIERIGLEVAYGTRLEVIQWKCHRRKCVIDKDK